MSTFGLRAISKGFGGNPILRSVTIEAEAGEFIALVGPSGCGKSTLLRIAAGLETADEGQVVIGERDATDLGPGERNVAMVFQSYALYPHLTAGQNIAVPLAMRELSALQRLPIIGSAMPGARGRAADIGRRVGEMAVSLKIDHLLDRKPGAMSGGQRQRVALARALVRRPDVFLMDEPLSNLDANLRVHARGEIVELHRRTGVPTLYVTHDQAEALSMADRVAVMIGGRVLQLASPQAIYDDPAHVEVARFVGSPRINLLPATLDPAGIARVGDVAILPVPGAAPGELVTIGVRPEHLVLREVGAEAIPARVGRLEYLGSEVLVFLDVEGLSDPCVAKVSPRQAASLRAGTALGLDVDPAHALVFDGDGARHPLPAVQPRRREPAHV
ncbi:ABC transporter ATP-binding protein [Aureimonas sp. AU12]|uniref:ABC transporter ATP-binding protein n=1 Tax=Aureimonas sp. AU12 TaxID=1638161 RepID=UPI00078663C3|nr:ABC transporter ATP-binding protein [Aureimonas sp. AU12]